MRRIVRTILIGVLVAAMSFNPAWAWNWFRSGCGGWGGSSSWGHCEWNAPYYYGGYYGSGYCGSYGYGSSYYPSSCGGCFDGGYDCGGAYDCGGCSGCGDVVMEHGYVESSPEGAPMPPPESTRPQRAMPRPQEPADVQRPMDTTPIPELPAEPMPDATQPTTPAEPADDVDDLFGPMTEATDTTPSATTPPTETTPPAQTPPPADDDLFGPLDGAATPPAETTPADPATPDAGADNFFGPMDTNATEGTLPADTDTTPPAEQPAEAEEETDLGEDIFDFGTSHDILGEPGGLSSNELRKWVDDTGKHSCRGRIVQFLGTRVRLLKDNGRTTTVSLNRLSAADLDFVQRQASAHQAEMAGQLVQSVGTFPLFAQ